MDAAQYFSLFALYQVSQVDQVDQVDQLDPGSIFVIFAPTDSVVIQHINI